jgi:hypothetical protein
LLAFTSLAVVLADARSAALLAAASLAVVLADARSTALLAPASAAVVLADARPAAFLAPTSLAVVLADAWAIALLAQSQDSAMLARACSLALPTLAFLAVVRALCALVLPRFAACPTTALSFFMLLLLGVVVFLGRGTLSLLHSLLFAFAFEATLLVLGLFLPLLFKASRLPPHLPHRAAPVLLPRPQHRTRREPDVSRPLSRFHARRCPQAELSQDQL